MKVTGLITEYNPFHNGHLYHIEESKKVTGADYVIAIMSGNFLQRGVPAIIDKKARTRMALLNGADLVLELPVYYATGSAEYFSSGAIALLHKLGIVDSICFGSECGDIAILTSIAKVLIDEPDTYRFLLKAYLSKGFSFPLARSKALTDYLYGENSTDYNKKEQLEKTIQNPNNILGIEYIKALLKRKSNITPYTFTRISNHYHDFELTNTISSATALRNSIQTNGNLNKLKTQVPENVYSILEDSFLRDFPIYEKDFSSILKYKLLSESSESLTDYIDMSKELSLRIKNNLDQFINFTQFASYLKTKELTHSRITRSLTHIILNLKKNDLEELVTTDYINYIRVLGFRKNSTSLLSGIKKASSVPIITKLADSKSILSETGMQMLSHDILASDIYHTIVTDKYGSPFCNEYSSEIVIIDS